MPIYEFYCENCNTMFDFFSKHVDTKKRPNCPKCKTQKLSRQVSLFAVSGRATEDGGMEDLPFDEARMTQAMQMLSSEADKVNEDDPRQAVNMMRKVSDMMGLKLGPGTDEVLSRMEKGDDPEQMEAEMGDLLMEEDPFKLPEKKGNTAKPVRPAPKKG